jgi:hypothetical protein
MTIDGATVPVVSLVIDPAALDSDLALVGETTRNLTTWAGAGGQLRRIAQTPAGDGLIAVLYQLTPPDGSGDPLYLRFSAEPR